MPKSCCVLWVLFAECYLVACGEAATNTSSSSSTEPSSPATSSPATSSPDSPTDTSELPAEPEPSAQGGAPASSGTEAPEPLPPGTADPNNGAEGAVAPLGFAAVAGMGLTTTTGGVGGETITVTNFDELNAQLDTEGPVVILVQGNIDLQGNMVPIRSNKTLLGLQDARLVNGGIEMNEQSNIIVRNIVFADGTDDTFKINQQSHHIWVDHCDFTNAPDGLFDITRQSSFITISWNHFYNHSKTMLIGHSDDEVLDVGHLKTTIHHNWFDGTEQRHPRVRFGEVHVFNNYFLANGLYGVASTMEADVLVEGNYFEGVAFPMYSGYDASGPGDLVERNNVFDNSGVPETRGSAFEASAAYAYTVEDPTLLPALLRAYSGAGVIDPLAIAP